MASAARPEEGAPLGPPPRLARALDEAEDDGAGRTWLRDLPELARDVLRRWELTPERVQEPGGRSSLLVLVRRADGGRAALKLLAPGADAAAQHAALERWDGFGAVRLLEADDAAGALLLERLHGEVSLSSLPEAKALLEAAGTVRRLWTEPDGGPYPSVAERTAPAAALLRAAADEPWAADVRPLAGQALAAHAELTAAEPERLLLHGRFREEKVLAGERAPWLAVGPDPLVGERAYDLALPVRDRLEDLVASPRGAAGARSRLARLADSLEVDRDRLRGWTVFRAVADGLPALGRGHRRGALLLEFASWF
ncbi:aminoglycoside phosphotransferase family protein [Streptomyces albus]|uniref:aminoglycoside phosphotransferase family protein n=1 Tax=Streptomyces albus TaxID=1888 RepID=UPI00068F8D28|nr:aminoglycoside phosphotransferase family protein [Streptomyces albus]